MVGLRCYICRNLWICNNLKIFTYLLSYQLKTAVFKAINYYIYAVHFEEKDPNHEIIKTRSLMSNVCYKETYTEGLGFPHSCLLRKKVKWPKPPPNDCPRKDFLPTCT